MQIYHMSDIIPLMGMPYPPSGRASYNVSCPCCDSRRTKHLNINLAKDVFRCPRCGFQGGVLDLYAHVAGIRREDAYATLKERLGTADIPAGNGPVRRASCAVPEINECPVTDIDTRDATYRALLQKLTLASDHRQNLLNRGLGEEIIIKNEYRTTPMVGTMALAKQLLTDGCYLSGVPGFYRESDGKWSFANGNRGILIPVRDMAGKIQGLQIRRDDATRRKFRWVSSAGRTDGCGAEGWVHISGPLQKQILLTEGPMKGDIIHYLSGQTVVAVPGVNSLAQLAKVLQELRDSGVQKIMTAFDMDFMKNHHVQSGYKELIRLLSGLGISYGTYLWQPEYNGLDDYIWQCLMREFSGA